MKAKLSAVLLGLALAWARPAAGADPHQAAARQGQIEADARQLVGRLDGILDEYRRNGLDDGGDFTAVQKLRAALGALSDQEMGEVVAMLREAGELQNPAQALQKMMEAGAGEKDISQKLRRLVAQYRRAHEMQAMAQALARLAERQAANLSSAADLAALNAEEGNAQATANAATTDEQRTEESAIAAEAKRIGEQMARGADNDPPAAAATAGLAALSPAAAAADQALAANKMDDAVAAEKEMGDRLREIAQSLAPSDDVLHAQAKAPGAIASLLKDEQDLAARTAQLDRQAGAAKGGAPDQVEKAIRAEIQKPGSALAQHLADEGLSADSPMEQLQTSPEVQAFAAAQAAASKQGRASLPGQLSALASAQQDLAARTQAILRPLEDEPAVKGPLQGAFADMQGAGDALSQPDPKTALKQQGAAMEELAAAQKAAAANGEGAAQAAAAAPREQAQGGQPANKSGAPGAGGKPMASQGAGPGEGAKEKPWQDTPGAVAPGKDATPGAAQFAGLPQRDRAAIRQSQAEKYPPQYGTMVEQYMRGLAEDTKEDSQAR